MPWRRTAPDDPDFLLFFFVFLFSTSLLICDHSGKFIKFYFAVDEIPPSPVLTLKMKPLRPEG